MSRRPDDGIKFGCDLRVRGQVIPERKFENIAIGGAAGPNVGEERSPRMSHTPAEPFEVEPHSLDGVEQRPCRFVQ